MKIQWILVFLVASLCSLSGCNNIFATSGDGVNKISPVTKQRPPVKKVETGFFYGVEFRGEGNYKEFLERCGRCGDRKYDFTTGSYTRTYRLFDKNQRGSCNELAKQKAYLQVEFTTKALPTAVNVWFKARPGNFIQGATPVKFQGKAYPINENKGFEIVLSQQQGVGGLGILRIYSEEDNIADNNDGKTKMRTTVTYGNGELFHGDMDRIKPPYGIDPISQTSTCLNYDF